MTRDCRLDKWKGLYVVQLPCIELGDHGVGELIVEIWGLLELPKLTGEMASYDLS